MFRGTRRTTRPGNRASIKNSALCRGLTAARNQGPEGQDIELGATVRQRCRQPTHCPCGSLTTESREGSRQGDCPSDLRKGSGHVWVFSSLKLWLTYAGLTVARQFFMVRMVPSPSKRSSLVTSVRSTT
jgi:hypothetical protein